MENIKNVLISGGAGFIGSNLAIRLTERGYSVTVLDNLSEQIHGSDVTKSFLFNSVKDKVKFIRGDVRNRSDWENALVDQDVVIHLAAETGTGQSMYEIYRYNDVNIGGTALLLDILVKDNRKIRKLIVASSRAVYGEGRYLCPLHGHVYPLIRDVNDLRLGLFECKCPVCKGDVELLSTSENDTINATSVYGITKHVQEQLIITAGKSMNIPSIAFRYQNVYGPGQSLSNPYTGILSIFSTQIKNGNPINIFEDGKESRDFVYIADVVDATILGLEYSGINSNVFNVGSGIPIDVLSIANKLISLYKTQTNVSITGNYRIGDIRHNYADLSKIKKDLKFSPKYDFDTGIANFVSWVNSQEIETDKYNESILELKSRGLMK